MQVVSDGFVIGYNNGSVRLWRPRCSANPCDVTVQLCNDAITTLTTNSTVVIVGTLCGVIIVVPLASLLVGNATGQFTLREHVGAIVGVEITGSRVISASHDNTIKVSSSSQSQSCNVVLGVEFD